MRKTREENLRLEGVDARFEALIGKLEKRSRMKGEEIERLKVEDVVVEQSGGPVVEETEGAVIEQPEEPVVEQPYGTVLEQPEDLIFKLPEGPLIEEPGVPVINQPNKSHGEDPACKKLIAGQIKAIEVEKQPDKALEEPGSKGPAAEQVEETLVEDAVTDEAEDFDVDSLTNSLLRRLSLS